MQPIYRLLSVQFLFLLVVGCSAIPWGGDESAAAVPFDAAAVNATGISKLINPDTNKFVGGQPDEAQLQQLANAGVQHIVNLRTDAEMGDMDERSIVEALGMSYYSLPIDGEEDITLENGQLFSEILDVIGDESALLHDGSGGRVGAMMAVDAKLKGSDVEQAVTTGRAWGLSGRILPAVRAAIGE